VVLKGGDCYAWGKNEDGKLGLGDRVGRATPTLNRFLPKVHKLASGGHHSFAILSDGTLWGWGWQSHNNIGNGNACDGVETPRLVLEDVEEVAAGWGHSLALLKDGTLMTWGYQNSATPKPITSCIVRGIGCTHSLSWVISEEGDIFHWSQGCEAKMTKIPHPQGKKWAKPRKRSELAWKEVFEWLFLGREDAGATLRFPVEVLFNFALQEFQ
jgi:alpha-tubulin suppressor-like RCC1 family protein